MEIDNKLNPASLSDCTCAAVYMDTVENRERAQCYLTSLRLQQCVAVSLATQESAVELTICCISILDRVWHS